ncbi:MAG: PopZ family protein [Microvirga sp.]
MEEILASIRRIIADDQEAPKPAPVPKSVPPAAFATPLPPAPAPLEDEDVLELGEVAQPVRLATRPIPLSDEPPDIAFREIEDAAEDEPPEVHEPPPRAPEPPPVMARPEPRPRGDPAEQLLSQTSHAAVGQAFNMLAHTVLTSNARTLEDLVREMLRPLLKNWLDDNLPTIVERLVRAEIERVARGGR